jgi:hypothetical protein
MIGLGITSMLQPRAGVAQPDRTENYVDGDGARLFLVRAGHGPLMVFLHRAPDDCSLHESQLREFGRDHLVAAADAGIPMLRNSASECDRSGRLDR